MQLTGVHHVSALSAHIGRTHDFYTRVLGLRPLIKTVNQDEPTMYHLFFGDGVGSPGSDITFFDLPHAAPERRGNNSISLTTFRISGPDTLAYWATRFEEHGVQHGEVAVRDGRRVLDFTDPEGTQLSLVDDGGRGQAFPWAESPVPAEYQIRGLGYTVLTVPELGPTDRFFTEALVLRRDREYPLAESPEYMVHVYAMGEGGVDAEVHLAVRDDIPRARYGAGGVHHVAFRIGADDRMEEWTERLDGLGYSNSGVVDRHFFISAYVREPNGITIELATDDPGFTVNGPLDAARLQLPPFLEPRRAEIEAKLKPIG
jgi:glyoxalase family protein